MTLNTNRQPGDLIEAGDINAIAKGINSAQSKHGELRGYVNQMFEFSPNLYNPASAVPNKFLQYDGQVVDHTTYHTSGFVAVQPGVTYTVTNPRSIGFFDADKAFVLFLDSAGGTPETFVVPEKCYYVRFSYRFDAANVQINEGATLATYTEYGTVKLTPYFVESLPAPSISNVTPAQVTFIDLGKNLYDPSDPDVQDGGYIRSDNGGWIVYEPYITTGYIPVYAETTYTISPGPKKFAYYDLDRNFKSGEEVDPATGKTFTPAADGYVRIGADKALNIQIEKGSVATEYEPYGMTLNPHIKVGEPDPKPISVTLTGTKLEVVDTGGSSVITTTLETEGRGNSVFNFSSAKIDGVTVTMSGDDISPVWSGVALGANHGHVIYAYTNPDSKNDSDLGSQWTDGTNTYALLGFDADGRVLMGRAPGKAVDGSTIVPLTKAAVDLTHVSGATHTGTVPVSAAVIYQLWPSVGRKTLTIETDGVRRHGDFRGQCSELVVRETYDVFDYDSIYTSATSNVGSQWWTLPQEATFTREISYSFIGGGVCDYYERIYEGVPTTINYGGFVQANMNGGAGSTIRYMPGVKVKSGFDFQSGVDMSTYGESLKFTNEDLIHPNDPPCFVLDQIRDSGGNTVGGFVIGYHPDRPGATNSKDRLSASPDLIWDLRSSKKIYPRSAGNFAPGWTTIEGHAYRIYLGPEETERLISDIKTRPRACYATLKTLAGF